MSASTTMAVLISEKNQDRQQLYQQQQQQHQAAKTAQMLSISMVFPFDGSLGVTLLTPRTTVHTSM